MRTHVLGAVVCAYALAGMATAEEIWHETAKLLPSAPFDDAHFGNSLLISGDLLLVGAPGDQDTGVVYIIDLENGAQLGKLLPEDAEPEDWFGGSIAVSADLLVVGASGNDELALNAGAAYVFDLETRMQVMKLLAEDGAAGDRLGASVAIDGNTIVVGSPSKDVNDVNKSGGAYVFDAETGEQVAAIDTPQPRIFGFFGGSVAVRGTTVVLGALGEMADGIDNAGAVYVFDTTLGSVIARLTAAEPSYFDRVGFAVAVGDDVILAGAPWDDTDDAAEGDHASAGAVHVFDLEDLQQTGTLFANAPDESLGFGTSIAIDGTTAVIGATAFQSYVGHAFVLDLASGTQIARLESSTPWDSVDFGAAVAVAGTRIAVGDARDAAHAPASGAAYVFSLLDCPASMLQSSILVNDDNGSGDVFGHAVALHGTQALINAAFEAPMAYLFDTATGEELHAFPSAPLAVPHLGDVALNDVAAVVGAPSDEHDGVLTGVVRVFDPETGALLTTLAADDGLPGDALGAAVAISGTTVIAGAPGRPGGAAYLFDAVTGQQLAALDPDVIGPSEQFGTSVDIDGAVAIVGVEIDSDSDGEPDAGGAYLFDVATGALIAELVADEVGAGERFGYDVAVGSGRALVGAPWSSTGAVYVFDTAKGALVDTLIPCEGLPYDWFGWQIDMAGDCAIVSAPRNDDDGDGAGCAYAFDMTTGEQLAKLEPTDGLFPHFSFGWAVAIDAGAALVGDHLLDFNGSLSGVAYLYDLVICPADLDGDGAVDGADLSLVLLAWSTPNGDITGDGTTDVEDLVEVVTNWGPCV